MCKLPSSTLHVVNTHCSFSKLLSLLPLVWRWISLLEYSNLQFLEILLFCGFPGTLPSIITPEARPERPQAVRVFSSFSWETPIKSMEMALGEKYLSPPAVNWSESESELLQKREALIWLSRSESDKTAADLRAHPSFDQDWNLLHGPWLPDSTFSIF